MADGFFARVLKNILRRGIKIEDRAVFVDDDHGIHAVIHQRTETAFHFIKFALKIFLIRHARSNIPFAAIPAPANDLAGPSFQSRRYAQRSQASRRASGDGALTFWNSFFQWNGRQALMIARLL